mgnify:CR=1 FL=1
MCRFLSEYKKNNLITKTSSKFFKIKYSQVYIIDKDSKSFIIAEIGVNHNGNIEIAKEMIDAASKTGVDAVKFQIFKTAELMVNNTPKAEYQKNTTKLDESFNDMIAKLEFPFESYERCGNSKGEYKNRGNKKILNIKYTPDFVGDNFIIECKGRANESFPIRWKLFKAYVHKHLPNITLYKPQNQKECEETVNLILGKRI